MKITQISEEQAKDMLVHIHAYLNLDDKIKTVASWKKAGYIKKSSIEEARAAVANYNNSGLTWGDIIPLWEKAYAELESKIEEG